eukprot:TRINITY_DN686_c0_g1_i10.p2 TRINITY_DN686_c0_g1~~TRINITY_DN686_c0_g1_i10.p2  ORF type:complete len:130 (-),score=8.56 TRINITY_DN686_c0_g1_i10:286-675(-)
MRQRFGFLLAKQSINQQRWHEKEVSAVVFIDFQTRKFSNVVVEGRREQGRTKIPKVEEPIMLNAHRCQIFSVWREGQSGNAKLVFCEFKFEGPFVCFINFDRRGMSGLEFGMSKKKEKKTARKQSQVSL